MRYHCLNESCKKVFMHPAKKTEHNHFFPKGGDLIPPVLSDQMEKHVCPFCHGLEFDEYVEPQQEIQSIKSVPIEDADALITQGYVVLEAFAKTVTLIKKEAKKVE